MQQSDVKNREENKIGIEGASSLSYALMYNSTLTEFSLERGNEKELGMNCTIIVSKMYRE